MVCLTHVVKGQLHVIGWTVVPPDRRQDLQFLVNGRLADRVIYPVPRPDVAERMPFAVGAAESGFDLFLTLPAGTTDPGDLKIECIDRRTGRPFGWDYEPYFVPSATRSGPLPTGNRIARVIGKDSDYYFRLGGYTTYQAMVRAVAAATGTNPADYRRVLDWGCGCGRVSRYFLDQPGCRLTGADVDADNVGWCRTNLPGGTWDVLPLRPPTTLPGGSFDLAIGVSVFTHLREPDQFAWLAELRRVIRPGGLALMTFHGRASIVWSDLSAERYTALKRRGICDQPNRIYDAELGEDDYYRDVYHTEQYVRRNWGKYFEVLAIYPCSVSHQDLVVMRRR
jgi:SAM-dependent methyltransferase